MGQPISTPEDYRLKRKAELGLTDANIPAWIYKYANNNGPAPTPMSGVNNNILVTTGLPNNLYPDAGYFPFPHDYSWESLKLTRWSKTEGNVWTGVMRLRTYYLRNALPFITGYTVINPEWPGKGPPLLRRLPMRFPVDMTNGSGFNPSDAKSTYWGLMASNILEVKLSGSTGLSASSWKGDGQAATIEVSPHYDFGNIQVPNVPGNPEGFFNKSQRSEFFDANDLSVDATAKGPGQPFPPQRSSDDPLRRYEWCEITIEFSHFDYWTRTDTFIDQITVPGYTALSESFRYTRTQFLPGIDYFTIPQGVIIWDAVAGPGAPFNNNDVSPNGASVLGGLTVPFHTLRIAWLEVPLDAISYLQQAIWPNFGIGKVNTDPVAIGYFNRMLTYPAQTLMCMAPDSGTITKIMPTGQMTADVTYNFMFRPNGWNKFLHANGAFYKVTLRNGLPPFPTTDFGPLFLNN